MNQSLRMASDVAALLLCCDDGQLETLARPLRRLVPEFGKDRVIRHAGHRLSRCPVLVAEFIEGFAEDFAHRPYGDVEADIAAAVLVAHGVTLNSKTTLYELHAEVVRQHGDRPLRSDLENLAIAMAELRLPIIHRAKIARLDIGQMPLSLGAEKSMTLEQVAIRMFKEFYEKFKQEQQKMGKVNILISGKTGVGKSTLINAVFGENVAPTGAGRPVTEEIRWYEPAGLPVKLCDTKGLELADFKTILSGIEAEIEKGISSGKIEDRIHLLWLCISESSARVEQGEIDLVDLCNRHRIPAIVVLTKAIGPKSFRAKVETLMPSAKQVVRVLAEEWDGDPPTQKFGLPELIRATHDLLPEATQNAFDSAQRILITRKRARAINAVLAAAGAAGIAAATPIPVADAAAVLSVNIGMIVSVSMVMGVQMSRSNIQTIAGSMLGAMAVAGGGRFVAGEVLKLIPGFGSVAGALITSGIAVSATYGLGYGYVEFLCRFQDAEQRMPAAEEIKVGFQKFWESWEAKDMKPPK